MSTSDTMTDLMMKTMNMVHKGLLAVSGGRIGGQLGSMPAVELHTTGRTSGKRRSVMLTAPVHGGGRYVLVASKGGDDRDPEWYRNLVFEPNVELTVGGETIPMTARTASSEEKAELWPQIVAAYKGYAGYQEKTEREIPVVICEPRAGS
jgi:deazaflavin-dependent oxidoreductase (nitroreductase family)